MLVDSKQAFFKGLFDGETDTVQFGEASGFLSRIQKLIDPSAIAVVAARGGQAEAEPDRGETDRTSTSTSTTRWSTRSTS